MLSSVQQRFKKKRAHISSSGQNQSQPMAYKGKAAPSCHRRIVTATCLAILSFTIFFVSDILFNPVAPVGNKYRGTPWSNERTVSIKTIGETKFARCDVHTVRSEDGQSEINDWLFLEEMDAVNVVVLTADGNFAVFEQKKYAIPGETFSPVGGFIDAEEAPWESARREVLEELGLGSRKTLHDMKKFMGRIIKDRSAGEEAFAILPKAPRILDEFNLAKGDVKDDEDWVYLGKYRTAANRGGGFIYTYLLKEAIQILPDGGTNKFRMKGDDEAQIIHMLSLEEVKEKVKLGEFQEVKWAATFALSLLHLSE